MITASKLRQDVYQLLDQVLERGKPLEIKRKGRLLRIVPDPLPASRLSKLQRHATLTCDPDEIVHLDWSDEWKPGIDLGA